MCGRLLCCLGYEYDVYKEMNKDFPAPGAKIEMDKKIYTVEMVDTLKGEIIIKDGNNFITISRKMLKRKGDHFFLKDNYYHEFPGLIGEVAIDKK